MASNEVHEANQTGGITLNQTGGGIIVALNSIAYSGDNATPVEFRDKRTAELFRDKRTPVEFRDKRTNG